MRIINVSILDIASAKSIWRGYDYFEQKKVIKVESESKTIIKGLVQGNSQSTYEVIVDLQHPKKSTCTCPHADGTRIICKHKVAVYFSAFPEEAQRLLDETFAYQEEAEKEQEQLEIKVVDFVRKLKKSELQELFLQMLFNGPDWQYEHFVRDYIE